MKINDSLKILSFVFVSVRVEVVVAVRRFLCVNNKNLYNIKLYTHKTYKTQTRSKRLFKGNNNSVFSLNYDCI